MMKVLHVPFTFSPDPIGGTEVYVEGLASSLRSYGVESLIAAPARKGMDEFYEHNGVRVHRYRWAAESQHILRELYGAGDPEAATAFARIIDDEAPDLVHLHAFTREVSILLVRAAKQRRIPVLFTYHTPTVSCHRGTLMLWGKEICDGALNVQRCSSCVLEARGLPRWGGEILSHTPSLLAKTLEKANRGGGIWTALRMSELIRMRCEAFQALMEEVDGVVALREWIRRLLVLNGVPTDKITLCQHGVVSVPEAGEPAIDVTLAPLRVAFLGRIDRTKGVDTLIKAIRAAPELSVELDIFGVIQSALDHEYRTMLKSFAAGDARIKFLPPAPHGEVVSTLKNYHLLAAPSRWLETGPLVILESFLAGTPVIGSNLGGIAELVRHGKNGLLVDFEDVGAWTDALRKCAKDRDLLARLRQGVEQPRSMKDIAREMAAIYADLVGSEQRFFPVGPTTTGSGYIRQI